MKLPVIAQCSCGSDKLALLIKDGRPHAGAFYCKRCAKFQGWAGKSMVKFLARFGFAVKEIGEVGHK